MTAADLTLLTPSPAWRAALLDMAREVAAFNELRYTSALADFDAYLSRLEDQAAGRSLPPGRCPQITYWAADGARLVGSSRLRHPLTPELEQFAGHIGYDIRPTCRRQGYGTRLLALTLVQARRLGLGGVWVNCFAENTASARVILANGGRLVDEVIFPENGKPITRYWIGLENLGIVDC